MDGAKCLRASSGFQNLQIVLVSVAPGSVDSAMQPLRMAMKLDPYRETAGTALEPWIVEPALDRLGERRLTRKKQELVVKATRTPKRVRWRDWWEVEV